MTTAPESRFKMGKQLGSGTYGVVYQALDTETNAPVAIKKMRIQSAQEGISLSTIRELKILKYERLRDHENILKLLFHYHVEKNIYLVYEFLPMGLKNILEKKPTPEDPTSGVLELGCIKTYLRCLLQGLAFCHAHWVLHRDIKPDNLLIAPDGTLKVADFGLARHYGSPNPQYTPTVATSFYRAPELFMGAQQYGPAIDVWSAGCVFAEMMLRRPLFQGQRDIDMLSVICNTLGTPINEQTWPGASRLAKFLEIPVDPAHPTLKTIFKAASEDTLDLLTKMLALQPSKRISAAEALEHPFFTNAPLPWPIERMPKPTIKL